MNYVIFLLLFLFICAFVIIVSEFKRKLVLLKKVNVKLVHDIEILKQNQNSIFDALVVLNNGGVSSDD